MNIPVILEGLLTKNRIYRCFLALKQYARHIKFFYKKKKYRANFRQFQGTILVSCKIYIQGLIFISIVKDPNLLYCNLVKCKKE